MCSPADRFAVIHALWDVTLSSTDDHATIHPLLMDAAIRYANPMIVIPSVHALVDSWDAIQGFCTLMHALAPTTHQSAIPMLIASAIHRTQISHDLAETATAYALIVQTAAEVGFPDAVAPFLGKLMTHPAYPRVVAHMVTAYAQRGEYPRAAAVLLHADLRSSIEGQCALLLLQYPPTTTTARPPEITAMMRLIDTRQLRPMEELQSRTSIACVLAHYAPAAAETYLGEMLNQLPPPQDNLIVGHVIDALITAGFAAEAFIILATVLRGVLSSGGQSRSHVAILVAGYDRLGLPILSERLLAWVNPHIADLVRGTMADRAWERGDWTRAWWF